MILKLLKRHKYLRSVFLTGLIALFGAGSAIGTDKMRGPYSSQTVRSVDVGAIDESTARLIGYGMMTFYARWISPVDGARSPSYPTGSMYGRMAVARYGFFTGVILTADRLIHESDLPLGPVFPILGRDRFYDPLIYNTFWWSAP